MQIPRIINPRIETIIRPRPTHSIVVHCFFFPFFEREDLEGSFFITKGFSDGRLGTLSRLGNLFSRLVRWVPSDFLWGFPALLNSSVSPRACRGGTSLFLAGSSISKSMVFRDGALLTGAGFGETYAEKSVHWRSPLDILRGVLSTVAGDGRLENFSRSEELALTAFVTVMPMGATLRLSCLEPLPLERVRESLERARESLERAREPLERGMDLWAFISG